MAVNPKTAVTLSRIAAILFALVAGDNLYVAYDAHRTGEHAAPYLKQAVLWTSLCVVFLTIARSRKRRAAQFGEETASPQSK